MNTIHQLIDQIAGDIRVYLGLEGYMEDIQCASGDSYVRKLETISEEEQEVIFVCRHEMFIPPASFSLIGYRPFGFDLPADVLYFFAKFPRVILWSHQDYQLGIPGWMVAYALDETLPYPFGLLRFCRVDLPDNCYFALRTKDGGMNWDVVFLGNVMSDLTEVLEQDSLYPSFTAWLSHMLECDGWIPLIRDLTEDWLIVVKRVLPAAEVLAKFGDINALLPPAVPSEWTIPSEDDE